MQKIQGWVEAGNTTLTIGGASGVIARKVQGSYPGATVTVYLNNPIAAAISAITRVSNVVTVTVPSNSGFIGGESVTIAGVTDATFNGTFTILSVGATTFTYAQTAVDASSSGGTAASSLRLATIYSDDATVPTSKANPFVSATDGTWFFYAANGRYNIKFSGAGITAPFTLGDFYLHDLSDLGIYNVMEYGATGNGSTDDRAALNTLANTTIPAAGGTMFFPPGTYKISSNITFPTYVTLQFSNGAKLSIDNGMVVTILDTVSAPQTQIISGSGTVALAAQREVLPQWWGALNDGSVDCASAINAAITAAQSGVVRLIAGTYKITNTAIVMNYNGSSLIGDGRGSTFINFQPTASGKIAIDVNGNGLIVDRIRIKGLTISSTGNTQTGKIGIRIVDGSEVILDDIQTANCSSASKDCIGLQTQGRQTHDLGNMILYADIPIDIAGNPNSTIDIDHYHFHDVLLGADSTKPCIQIESGVNLTHVTFDGYVACVTGKYAVYWNDTTTSQVSIALSIRNLRWEQETDATGYMIYLKHNYGLQQLLIENVYGGSTGNGLYFRNIQTAALANVFYSNSGGSKVFIDADSSNLKFDLRNVHSNVVNTLTLSIISINGVVYNGGNVFYYAPRAATGANMTQSINPSSTLGLSQLEPLTVSLDNNATVEISTNQLQAIALITTSTGFPGMFSINGANNSVTEMSDPGGVWGTAVSAGSNYNLYWNAGTSRYRLQNIGGGTVTFRITLVAASGERN